MKEAWVYVLRCGDDSLYTGWTTNPPRRLQQHQSGKGAKYTRSRLPVQMVGLCQCANQKEAQQMEYQIKQLPRAKKLEWIKANPA